MSPMNTTTEAFEVFLTDGTSTCDCFRCGMDIDIDTGRDLLQCFNQDTINGNKCPPPLNGSAWHQRFTEISAINAQGATDGVILDNFKAVLKQGVSAIIDKSTKSNFTFCHAECSDTVRQVDAFGLHLIQEIHDRYIGNKTIVIEMEYADLGITIELSSLFSEDVQEYIFPSNASPQDADTIRLPRQVLPSGTGYLVNVKYAEPRVVMETANINVEGRSLQSIILSSTVYPKPLFPLPDNAPVKLAFQHRDLLNASVKDVSCEFIEYGGPDGLTATWNSTGCVVHSTSQAVTVCHCNHLTSFGVLVRLREFEVAPIHATSLELISVIGCGISLFTIVMTLLTFALLGLCTNERIIHGNLCVAIGLGQIVFLAGIGQTRNKIACTAVSALLHYFFTSVFCWMLVEGIQIYLQLVVVFNTALKKRFVVYHLTGWGVPFVVVAISVGIGHGNYVSDQSCWLPIQHGMIYAFVGPVLAIVLFNMAILGITVRIISRLLANTTEDKYANIRSSLKAAIILFPLLGMTWLFGLLSVSRHTIFFEYVFAILNSLQGFFIFIFYCWNSTEVRSQLSRKRATFLIDREYSGSVRGWSTFSMTANRVKPSPPTSSTSVNRD
ncbi:adhesion G-protein coupled receptor D1-like [Ptychodera flava]|uniref:adhesion G-protein coupled receptor D1-like n=1 Tax=Ptychodera flava TaxID=63121 RepID=UPI00396A0897